jgi:acyl carrier protein
MSNIETKVRTILSEVFEVDLNKIENPSKINIVQWDSLKHMELIFRIEEEFEKRLTVEEAMSIDSMEKIVDLLGEIK